MLGSRGTPSQLVLYGLKNMCATFDAFTRFVTIFPLTDRTIRSPQGIGISTETYGTFLTPVIMGKIPQELRLILSRGASDERDLDTSTNSFTEELRIRERCALGPVTEQARKKEKREFGFGFRPGQNRRPPTSSTLFSNNEGPPLNKDKWCTFCNGPDPSTKCACCN